MNDVVDGEMLVTATWTLAVSQGVDPDPNSHLIGIPGLAIPNGTGALTATTQRIAGLLPDVTYMVRADVTTTLGNTLSLWAHIRGVRP